MSGRAARYCSFCGFSDRERYLINGPETVNICETCAELCWDIIERKRFDLARPPMQPEALLPPTSPPDLERAVPKSPAAIRPLEPERPGFVYFVHAKISKRIKIGWSADPDKRIGTFLTGCPEPLEYLGSIPGHISDERGWHDRFAADRAHREWFNATPELLAYIAEVTKG